ncbi:hypothetical protein [Streptomyces goshikiensis]|uniref:hypothetical protein n=1 Tax=Streptomyces goshikiensis TaxID=1942 RepID=UPI0036A49084
MSMTAQTLLAEGLAGHSVTLTDAAPQLHGRTSATLKPTTAVVLGGYIYQHTPDAVHTELAVDRIASPWRAVLSSSTGWKRRRILVGDHHDEESLDGCLIEELCGNAGCYMEPAPAGPGSRCHRHFTDPVARGLPSTYWAELAAQAWAHVHRQTGEAGRVWRTRRSSLVIGCHEAGMQKMRLHEITGLSRATIDGIIERTPIISAGDDLYGPA